MTTALYGLVKGLSLPTTPLRATWSSVSASTNLPPRSAHSISILAGRVYIFGGETDRGQLHDSTWLVCTLPSSALQDADFQSLPPNDMENSPPSRAGHTAMVIGRKIYVYGGRDAEGSPLDEHGKIWVFATDTGQWSSIDPTSKSPRLPDRFDHAMVADEHPLPTLRSDKERPEPIDPDVHYGTIFVHAGIGKARKRLNDLWSFDLASRTWAQFADAPEPVRSGASLALAQNRIYRFGGYDGQNDVGGKLDYLDLKVAIFDDQTMTGEVALTALSGVWDSLPLEGPTDSVELLPRPVARSYAGLVPVSLGQGRSYLLLIGGDGSAGKAAGDHSSNICSDIWSYQLRPQGMTAASIKDATRMVAGKETGEGKWEPVEVQGESDFDGEEIRDGIGPGPRIRYDCAAVDFDTTKIVLWGGIGAGGQRWGDGWILNVI